MTNCTKEAQNDAVKPKNDAIDLISRYDAIKTVCDWMITELGYLDINRVERLIDAIEELPSVDKTGKWILSDNQSREDMENGNYYYVCSNCLHGDVHAKTREVPYCWHCGAMMEGEVYE